MLWIALNLPQLPLDTILRLQPRASLQADGQLHEQVRGQLLAPLVVTHKKRIGWCTSGALDAGILPGMSEANAWSMAADLQVHARDALRERQALEEAALWALHFTPQVALRLSVPAGMSSSAKSAASVGQSDGKAGKVSLDAVQRCGLLAEVAPSLRLFGGLHALQARLARGIAELGLQGCWASAPTATGAWLLAQTAPLTPLDATHVRLISQRAGDTGANGGNGGNGDPGTGPKPFDAASQLDALPIHVLDTVQPHLATLTGIGCTTLGTLRRLPRGGLARRFGKALLDEIDRAYGDQPEVHRWFEAPENIDLKLELPARVENTEALLFAARRLLMQLTGWLTARHAAVAGITLWLHHEPARRRDSNNMLGISAASTPVAILLATPSRNADHLGLLLRERLAQVVLSAPVIEIALVADRIASQAAPNTELFPTVASDTETTGRLVERLQSRLGTDAVRLLATCADHRPEKSHASPSLHGRPVRPVRSASLAGVVHSAAGRGKGTAAGVLPAGLDAHVILAPCGMRPGWLLAQPLALLTRQHRPFYQSPLTLLAGPDRIETGWWDDALALRDYFIAENDRHVLLWIFRLRPDGQGPEEDWFLHGFFA